MTLIRQISKVTKIRDSGDRCAFVVLIVDLNLILILNLSVKGEICRPPEVINVSLFRQSLRIAVPIFMGGLQRASDPPPYEKGRWVLSSPLSLVGKGGVKFFIGRGVRGRQPQFVRIAFFRSV